MKRLNGGEYLVDLSNGTIDDGALLGVNDEFLSLFPIVRGNIKKNRIYVKMNDIIIPCVYMISGLILTISGVFNDGKNGLVLLSIACEYDVDEYDVISIVGIGIDSVQKSDVLSTEDITGGTIENAKPIYFHPIVLLKGQVSDLTTYLRLTMIIIDNKSTAYTLEELYDKVKSVPQGRFQTNGIDCNSEQPLYLFNQASPDVVEIVHATSAATQLDKTAFIAYFDSISDPVNKIN